MDINTTRRSSIIQPLEYTHTQRWRGDLLYLLGYTNYLIYGCSPCGGWRVSTIPSSFSPLVAVSIRSTVAFSERKI